MCHYSIARQGVRKARCLQEEDTLLQYSAGRMQFKYHRGHCGGQEGFAGYEESITASGKIHHVLVVKNDKDAATTTTAMLKRSTRQQQ